MDDHTPSPYQQMAGLLRREGRTREASEVLIAGNERVQRGAMGRLRRVFLGTTIAYGFRPWRVLWVLIPLFVRPNAFVVRDDLVGGYENTFTGGLMWTWNIDEWYVIEPQPGT